MWKYVPIVSSGALTNEQVFELFLREFARTKQTSKFGTRSQREVLKPKEAIEIVKYCGKEELIERLEKVQVPKLRSLSAKSPLIRALMFYDHETNQKQSFDYMIQKKVLRFNHLYNDLVEKWVDSNLMMSDKELVESLTDLDSYVKPPKVKKLKKLEK